jgi:hypothetical protein
MTHGNSSSQSKEHYLGNVGEQRSKAAPFQIPSWCHASGRTTHCWLRCNGVPVKTYKGCLPSSILPHSVSKHKGQQAEVSLTAIPPKQKHKEIAGSEHNGAKADHQCTSKLCKPMLGLANPACCRSSC